MPIPTRRDIDVYGSPDEGAACQHFLGKTVEDAEILFREAGIVYQEDLMWMGAVAFRYYVKAAIAYIRSEMAIGDACMVRSFSAVLQFRLDTDPEAALLPVVDDLLSVCVYIMENTNKFDFQPELDGDIGFKLAFLHQALEGLI